MSWLDVCYTEDGILKIMESPSALKMANEDMVVATYEHIREIAGDLGVLANSKECSVFYYREMKLIQNWFVVVYEVVLDWNDNRNEIVLAEFNNENPTIARKMAYCFLIKYIYQKIRERHPLFEG